MLVQDNLGDYQGPKALIVLIFERFWQTSMLICAIIYDNLFSKVLKKFNEIICEKI